MGRQNRLSALVLNVSNPAGLAAFYCDTLGMTRFDQGKDIAVGYGGQGAALILRTAPQTSCYQHAADDRYWKIAITLPNLDMAHAQLTKGGIAVSDPHQFQEIAYMSHLADPEGHIIELIQHTFAGRARTCEGDASVPLGGGAQIGLVTLRTSDIARERRYVTDQLGMTYLSRQAVMGHNFCLYFYGYTEDAPPNPDINAVENREWLWQRPYTTLEFQHRLGNEDIEPAKGDNASGFAHIIIQRGDGKRTLFR